MSSVQPPSQMFSSNHQQQRLTMSLASNTSSESDPDLLETCQATTLLADLEDEEELPDPEDENEDDENEDDDYEDMLDEECYETRNGASGRHSSGSKRRSWDDEYVLKRQFSALIPAFDPRPGRTNINQTTDLQIPPPGSNEEPAEVRDITPQPRILLSLRGPNMTGVSEIEMDLSNPSWTIFSAVQHLIQNTDFGTRQEKMRRVWEPTYVLVYREAKPEDELLSKISIPMAQLRTISTPSTTNCNSANSTLSGGMSNAGGCKDSLSTNGSRSIVSTPVSKRRRVLSTSVDTINGNGCSVDEVLQLLRVLFGLIKQESEADSVSSLLSFGRSIDPQFVVSSEEFVSKKITNKLAQQVQGSFTLLRPV